MKHRPLRHYYHAIFLSSQVHQDIQLSPLQNFSQSCFPIPDTNEQVIVSLCNAHPTLSFNKFLNNLNITQRIDNNSTF